MRQMDSVELGAHGLLDTGGLEADGLESVALALPIS
jgi:hypothetical protein